jgi:nucleophosmin 1
MFWGCVLKEGEPYKVQHALEDGEYPVLHVSNAVLSQNASEKHGKSYVTASLGKELKNLTVAVLAPNRHEVQPLDLYLNISQNITLSVVGKNEVHLSGYFEPNNSVEDQLYGAGMEDELDDDEEEEEEDVEDKLFGAPSGAKKASAGENLDKSLKAARKNALKNTMNEDDDDSSDEEDDDSEEEGEGKSSGSGEGSSSLEDIDGIDLEAEEGEDEDLDSDELGDSDSEDAKMMAKLQEIRKKQNKGKNQPTPSESDDDVSDLEDDSDDSEEADLKALLSKKK